MMDIQENVSIKNKTTMRVGGTVRYFAELNSREDVEQAYAFAQEKDVPLIVLGGGTNSAFTEELNALVVRIKASDVSVHGNTVTVQSGKILAMLINELAAQGLDLSALTGIPGSIGGAVFGNAGQGPSGRWIDSFIESVRVYVDDEWKTLSKEECDYRYRESWFKDQANPPLIWETTLAVPSGNPEEVKAEVERLLQKRIETQPHLKTAGSCFKATADGTPAWKLIDAAGFRGLQIGGIQISEKHANFLLNIEDGSFEDVVSLTQKIRDAIPEIAGIEMRLYGKDGTLL